MLKKEKIDRINHLAKKSKQEGLTEAEKEEQAVLRKEYIENFREQFKGHLNRMKFVEDLSKKRTGQTAKRKTRKSAEPMPRLSVNRNIWNSPGQLREKSRKIYDKNRQIRIEMTAGNSTFPAFCVIR